MTRTYDAIVVGGGRVFTIFDEGPTGVYQRLPQNCSLVARDSANGVLLWKVPMQDWQPEFGTGTGNRWNIHHTIPRRLVVDGDRVLALLAADWKTSGRLTWRRTSSFGAAARVMEKMRESPRKIAYFM